MELVRFYQQQLVSYLLLILFVGFILIFLVAIVCPIRKRLKNISNHEKDLNERIVSIKSNQCLGVAEAVKLEQDLASLFELFEESYKVDVSDIEAEKESGLKRRVLRWCHIHSNVQKYLKKEITFSDLKCLI